jgi:hypothetical protein
MAALRGAAGAHRSRGALSQRSASERRSVLLAACHAQVEDIDGNDVDLGSFAGKVVCVVNVATE